MLSVLVTLIAYSVAPPGRLHPRPPTVARAAPARLCSTRSAPPSPPAQSTGRRGGGGDDGLLLASMSQEERRAMVALWKFHYEMSKTPEYDEDAKAAMYVASWAEDQQAGLSLLQPRSWRAGFGPGSTEAIIVTRYELDASHWRNVLLGKHVLIVDQILLSPSVPAHLRGIVHAAIVQAFVLYGQYHAQNVRYQDHLHDFDI